MKNIIICGDCGERELTQTVVKACSNYGGAFVVDGTEIFQTCDEPEFSIISLNSISSTYCTGVMIFGSALCCVNPFLDTGDTIPVTDSENADALKILSRSGKAVIGCSMSGCDTLSLSCIDGEYRMVSLQRGIITVSGTLTEPCEIKVTAPPETDVFPLLAACAVLLLYDVPFDKGYEFR